MSKKIKLHNKFISLVNLIVLLLSSCADRESKKTHSGVYPFPTYVYDILPSGNAEFVHYFPSKNFDFNIEFDYPSSWWLQEHTNEIALESVFLGDPRFLSLPTPTYDTYHPTPNDFGSVYIWVMSRGYGQSPDSELEEHKESYSNTHWIKVLNNYTIKIDGYYATVLEYQIEPFDNGYTDLMFSKRIYFMVKRQVYEIIFTVADKDRGGDFEKGFDYLLSSIKIVLK
ncbi:MAG TPA: hypothetical protein DIW23_02665 [Anaerolineae bacterium]|nr:hypothetical protein [Anaerolineae bacterium]